jgi:hypothetical protein
MSEYKKIEITILSLDFSFFKNIRNAKTGNKKE